MPRLSPLHSGCPHYQHSGWDQALSLPTACTHYHTAATVANRVATASTTGSIPRATNTSLQPPTSQRESRSDDSITATLCEAYTRPMHVAQPCRGERAKATRGMGMTRAKWGHKSCFGHFASIETQRRLVGLLPEATEHGCPSTQVPLAQQRWPARVRVGLASKLSIATQSITALLSTKRWTVLRAMINS